MICPNCKIEMIEGSLSNYGLSWMAKPGEFRQKLIRFVVATNLVIAWKCSNCKKVELETK